VKGKRLPRIAVMAVASMCQEGPGRGTDKSYLEQTVNIRTHFL
jgi:hypothetical protein